MSPRAGLSTDAVVTAALDLVDERGLDALSLTAVAARSGVATPSLYKHIDGLPALKQLASVRLLDELAEHLGTAADGRHGADAVQAICVAYRGFVHTSTSRRLILERAAPATDTGLYDASNRVLAVVLGVMASYGLTGTAAIHATRCLRSAVHGFVVLELAGGFGRPEDVDASFEHLINLITNGLPLLATSAGS